MPRGDGTGPAGQGAGTGWNRLKCISGRRANAGSGPGGFQGGGRCRANQVGNNVSGRGGVRGLGQGLGRGVQVVKQQGTD